MKTLRELLQLLGRMEDTYRPQENPSMRWVLREREIVGNWLERLRVAHGANAANELWREVQNASHLIGTAIDDELGREHQALEARLWDDIAAVVVEERRKG